jgi:hypothetical protein
VVYQEELALVVTEDAPKASVVSMTCCGLPTLSGVWSMKSSSDGPCPYTGALSKYGRYYDV